MDKALLMFHGGVRSANKALADGQEHTLYFKAKTPLEFSCFLGAESRYTKDEEGDVGREKTRARYIASSMCDEAGTLLFTDKEALELIPSIMKAELCQLITAGSSQPGEVGKASPPRENSGSGTSSPLPLVAVR